ncbi:hypothetical protein BDFB_011465 [Asbolus verrucosus]|uniref:Uncharacterized protein n=1 Tax=Asbolus verrucosus TaxID=1661398 RepID=A0A482VJ22_ASBVE|nr:hypothetical protein BDFB_011465 [Asbolus verrucosus]
MYENEYQSITAWCKSTVKNNVDTSIYPKLKAFLKEQCPNVQAFSVHEVTKIISATLEEKFFMLKVAFLIGVVGVRN